MTSNCSNDPTLAVTLENLGVPVFLVYTGNDSSVPDAFQNYILAPWDTFNDSNAKVPVETANFIRGFACTLMPPNGME